MAFLIKNLFLKARKLILKVEDISAQDFTFFAVFSPAHSLATSSPCKLPHMFSTTRWKHSKCFLFHKRLTPNDILTFNTSHAKCCSTLISTN